MLAKMLAKKSYFLDFYVNDRFNFYDQRSNLENIYVFDIELPELVRMIPNTIWLRAYILRKSGFNFYLTARIEPLSSDMRFSRGLLKIMSKKNLHFFGKSRIFQRKFSLKYYWFSKKIQKSEKIRIFFGKILDFL